MNKLIAFADKHFVDDWREFHKWGSVRLLTVGGLAGTYFLAAPEQLIQVISWLPDSLKGWVPAWLGIALTALTLFVRLYEKNKPVKVDDGQ